MNKASPFSKSTAGAPASKPLARLKDQMNLAHLRVRRISAIRAVVLLRALGLNIRRCAAIGPPS